MLFVLLIIDQYSMQLILQWREVARSSACSRLFCELPVVDGRTIVPSQLMPSLSRLHRPWLKRIGIGNGKQKTTSSVMAKAVAACCNHLNTYLMCASAAGNDVWRRLMRRGLPGSYFMAASSGSLVAESRRRNTACIW